MSNFEKFENHGQQRAENRGIQQAAQEGYRSNDQFNRLGRIDNHAINEHFGGMQIVDNGKVVASTTHSTEQAHNQFSFGAWRAGQLQNRDQHGFQPLQQAENRAPQYEQYRNQHPRTNFGGWHNEGMPAPAQDKQTMFHTLQRTFGTDLKFHSYARQQGR